MRYLCLGYYDPAAFGALSAEEQRAIGDECRPHDEAFQASGRVRVVASLEHGVARAIRPAGHGPSVTDGPYAEAKEVVGSFFIIEAGDLGEAVRIASLHPAANVRPDLGFALEIRPIEFYREES